MISLLLINLRFKGSFYAPVLFYFLRVLPEPGSKAGKITVKVPKKAKKAAKKAFTKKNLSARKAVKVK